MIRCWPSVAKLYEPHEICENRVTFVNVRPLYSIDQDFTVNYCLRAKFKSSTRDWIGIFPRDWLNLQQYLTFEYTLSSPPNARDPHNRTITFPRIFHREASSNLEYQLVYVSREIQIMATSRYFRFTSPSSNNQIQSVLSKHAEPCPTVKRVQSGAIAKIDSSPDIPTNGNQHSTNEDDNERMAKEETQNNGTNGSAMSQPSCGHQQLCGLKIDALRGDFLASFSDSLLDRVRRLERDLSLAEIHLKNAKNSRDNIGKRLKAYEKFVAEMVNCVDARGIVRFTDEKGNDIILQRINKENRPTTENAGENVSLENVIVSLKSTIEKQQKTINDLIKRGSLCVRKKESAKCIDRGVQTNSPSVSVASLNNEANAAKKLNEELEKFLPKVQTVNNETTDAADKGIEKAGSPKCSREEKRAASRNTTEPRVLRIQKPSGILVQGRNVKFAIIRL